jgi:hypothetical protein
MLLATLQLQALRLHTQVDSWAWARARACHPAIIPQKLRESTFLHSAIVPEKLRESVFCTLRLSHKSFLSQLFALRPSPQ